MKNRVSPSGNVPAASSVRRPGVADVVDLAARRDAAGGVPPIPDHVLDEVEAAARRWHDLRASNREVRFDAGVSAGRVAASLCDLDGNVVRPLRPGDVTGAFDVDGPPPAA